MRLKQRAIFALASLAALGAAKRAAADPKAECAAAYEDAQRHRNQRHLIEAQRALIRCAQEACPTAAKRDCHRWLTEVEESLPSIVVSAHDESGKDVADVAVLIDGSTVAESLDGKSIALDPGVHAIRYRHRGAPIGEESITVLEGEKNRKISAFVPGGDPTRPHSPIVEVPKETEGGAVSPFAIAFAATSAVGFGGFALFGIASLNEESRDRRMGGCAPGCNSDQVASIRRKEHLADVSLLLGLAALGAAAYAFFRGEP